MNPILWQKIEGGVVCAAALVLAGVTQPGWGWWAWLLVFLPDLAMMAYLAGPKPGAFVYNLFHLYAGGLVLAMLGVLAGQPDVIFLGALWLAHVGFDRAIGYGLKSPSGFQDTHLGRIGRD